MRLSGAFLEFVHYNVLSFIFLSLFVKLLAYDPDSTNCSSSLNILTSSLHPWLLNCQVIKCSKELWFSERNVVVTA